MNQTKIKLDSLRTFITVAEAGHLSAAAQLLNRSPAAVSMNLKQFEASFGSALFETDRKSTLTPLGHFVLEEGRRALAGFDEAIQSIHRFAQGTAGVVQVAAVPSVAACLLPDATQRFQSTAPQVRLELRDLDSSLVAQAVHNERVDLGIASLSAAAYELQQEILLEEPFGVVCHPQHPLAQSQHPIHWSQLQQHCFISHGLCETLQHPSLTPILNQTTIHIHNVTTLLSFIQQNMGATLLPRMAVREELGLIFIPLADKHVIRRLYFLQNPQHPLSPAAQAFKQAIKASIVAIQPQENTPQ